MGRKKSSKEQNISLNLLGILAIAPLIILKFIGDGIIAFGKYSLQLTFEAYKKIDDLICFLNKIIFIKKPKPKKVVFRYHKFSLPKIHLPKFPAISIPSNIFFIKTKYFFLGAVTVGIIFSGVQINRLIYLLPNPNYLSLRDIPATSKIYDRNNKLLYEIYADENRTPIKLSQIPKLVKDATIAVEDSEFLSHQGISIRGLLRALYHNLTTDSLEGGSTITQQLIRSALLTPEKTLMRKLKEIVLSVWAERVYSKEQILEMYLNQVPYGGTAWGIEAAAETYFGKNVNSLTLSEAAFLAGLPAAPTQFSPYGANPTLAKARQVQVLKRMADLGYITKNQEEEAKNETLKIRKPTIPIAAPHFVMYIKDLLEQQYGANIVERGGLRITTSLDLDIQEIAQKAVSSQLENLRLLNVGNGAALIINPATGEILAMVGSRDYFDRENDGNVNLTTSLRQPGSSIKVVNYAVALSQNFTAASVLDDSPVSFKLAGLPSYTPVNYDGQFHGRIPLRTALASSYNIPAVKVLATVGVDKMIKTGKQMGIESWTDESRYGLSLTLGGGEVTMLDMARVYGTLATGGTKHNLKPILKITNWRGETVPLPTREETISAISPQVSYLLSNILSDNLARAPAFGANSALVIKGKTAAVKTGTSDNKRDNWTIGYSPDYVAVVWVGNNDNSPMNRELTSGITGAAPIWNEIMTNLLKDKPDKPFPIPDKIISLPCYGRVEYFIEGTQPKGGCPILISPSPTPIN